MSDHKSIIVRSLGLTNYSDTYEKMQAFSASRDSLSTDEIWLVQHRPVYTLGRNAKRHHVLNPGNIPVVQVDRGGQVTYHGPGQIVLYPLLDVRRNGFGVRQIVTAMEQAIVNLLASMDITAVARADAPGVYVDQKKIASVGLRIKNGKSYHGLALNVDMDLAPFEGINPCGYEGLKVTQIKNEIGNVSMTDIEENLVKALVHELNFDTIENE